MVVRHHKDARDKITFLLLHEQEHFDNSAELVPPTRVCVISCLKVIAAAVPKMMMPSPISTLLASIQAVDNDGSANE